MSKRSSLGGIVRRTLSDITNSVTHQTKTIPEKIVLPSEPLVKEYMDRLTKENMVLARLVEDKNKIIQLTGTELHKLRLDLENMQNNLQKTQIERQKMQMQNWSLAQSNSRMLAELNITKDKLKLLQHEAACKDVLLKAKNEEMKANVENENNQQNLSKKGQEAVDEQKSQCNAEVHKTRRVETRSLSMGPITTSQDVAGKEVSENKRRCLRRRSARVSSQEPEPAENLFEIGDAQFLAGPSVDYPLSKVSAKSSTKKEKSEIGNLDPSFDVFQNRRASIGRPTRRAAVKIQSYKEIPVNIKMRRSE